MFNMNFDRVHFARTDYDKFREAGGKGSSREGRALKAKAERNRERYNERKAANGGSASGIG